MTNQGRSLDDLPLAAYSTGAAPDDRAERDPETAPPHAGLSELVPPFAPAYAAVAAGVALPASEGPATRRPLDLPDWLANPREHPRDPRLLLTGVICLGVLLFAASLVFGGRSNGGTGAPIASATTQPAAVATVAPPSGNATIELSGKVAGAFALAGASGTGPPLDGRIDAAWADTTGSGMSLAGAASQGTRTTDASFVLTFTALLNGTATTFSSRDGECTVGMAIQPKRITGSFSCKSLKSDDGKVVVAVRGTYST